MSETKVIAHRGWSGRYPENTLVAFRKACALGVDEIEFDVQLTRDGRPVILHDLTVDRTTNGTGLLSGLTWREVAGLDAGAWHGPEFAGTRIPRLEEVVATVPRNVQMNIHLKPDHRDGSGNLLLERTIGVLLKSGQVDHAYLALTPRLIGDARKIRPRIRTCNMGRAAKDPRSYIEETRACGAERLQFFTPAYALEEAIVKEAHACGIFVNLFYADTESDMRRYIGWGVDAILTNHPDIMLAVLREPSRE